MSIKPEDVELSIAGNTIKSPSQDEVTRMCDWSTTPVQCPACGRFGLHACPNDPPLGIQLLGDWPSQTGDEIVSDMKVEAQRVGGVDLGAGIYRHCGIQPGDTWVERLERVNALVDGYQEQQGAAAEQVDGPAPVGNAKGLVVTFEGIASGGLVRLVTDTLRQFRGVASVDPVPEDGINDYIIRQEAKHDIWKKIRQVFE